MLLALAIAALSSVVAQCIVLPFAPTTYALLSPVHTVCCLLSLLCLHPACSAILKRYAEYGSRQVSAEQLAGTGLE